MATEQPVIPWDQIWSYYNGWFNRKAWVGWEAKQRYIKNKVNGELRHTTNRKID